MDRSVRLTAGDRRGLERLARYLVRCPFSLSRMIRVTEAGKVLYRAEKAECRRFPGGGGFRAANAGAELFGGVSRNFQVFWPAGLPGRGHPARSGSVGAPRALPGLELGLVLQQEPWSASQEWRGRSGGDGRAHRRHRRLAHARPGRESPTLGAAHPACLRGRSAHLQPVRRADEGDRLHRAMPARSASPK